MLLAKESKDYILILLVQKGSKYNKYNIKYTRLFQIDKITKDISHIRTLRFDNKKQSSDSKMADLHLIFYILMKFYYSLARPKDIPMKKVYKILDMDRDQLNLLISIIDVKEVLE